jgi:hypothetical protein
MDRLSECKRDLKQIKFFSINDDVFCAEEKVNSLSNLELIQMTQSKKMVRIGEHKTSKGILVIYKLRQGITNPKKSDRDGLRIWFCVDALGKKTTCLIQKADKNKQNQRQTLHEVKQRLKTL